jgi:transposase-like protein
MADNLFGIITYKCPQCGKSFDRLSPEWAYKIVYCNGVKYFCSYKCWMQVKRNKEKSRDAHAIPPETVKAINKMLDEGVSMNEIAKRLKVGIASVYRLKEKKRKETP